MQRLLLVFMIVLLLILFSVWEKTQKNKSIDSEVEKYQRFYEEINSDMTKYKLDEKDRETIRELINKILDEKKNKNITDYIQTARLGMIRGCITGFILGSGDIYNILLSGSSYALISPLMLYLD